MAWHTLAEANRLKFTLVPDEILLGNTLEADLARPSIMVNEDE